MRAIFDHNGFTNMGDVPNPPPKTYAIPIMPNNNVISPSFSAADLIMPTVKIWNFELYDVTSVDGEKIAIYKFTGES